MKPGAPLFTAKRVWTCVQHPSATFSADPWRNGNVEAGLPLLALSTRRVRNAPAAACHLETPRSLIDRGWPLNLRTSTQTPFLPQSKVGYLLGLFRIKCTSIPNGSEAAGAKQGCCAKICAPLPPWFAPPGEMGLRVRTVYWCDHTASLQDAVKLNEDSTLTAIFASCFQYRGLRQSRRRSP
jgi:hypothetical protein